MSTIPDLNKKIAKQVEFYLSDYNLPYDRFLYTLHTKDASNWIPIETLSSFKKMKMLTEDLDTVKKALKEHSSDIYEVNEEGDKIRRKTELVELDLDARTVHAKGFPLVDAAPEVTDKKDALLKLQDEVEEFFEEKGTVRCIRLKHEPKHPRAFKGSAYITFDSEDQAKTVADLKEVTFKDSKIILTYKPEYLKMKAEEYADAPRDRTRGPKLFNIFKQNRYAKPETKAVKRDLENKEDTGASETKKAKKDE